MSRNLSDFQHERDLLRRIADLEQKQRERGTPQLQGPNVSPVFRYEFAQADFDDTTPVYFTATISALAAGARARRSFSFRATGISDLTTYPTVFEPALALYVDTNANENYLWDQGGLLSSGQKNLSVSIVRDWKFGLSPQDPQNIATYHVQLTNHDSSAHTYYLQMAFFGPLGVGPLVQVPIL